MAKRPLPLPKPLRIVRNHPRLIVAAALGAIVALVLPSSLRLSTRSLIGWDVGAVCYLIAAFVLVQDFDLKRIQQRADQYDEGGLLILILTVAAAIASLAAIVAELGATRAENVSDRLAFLLAAGTTVLSWALIHTIFAFHYAHRCYRGPSTRCSGLVFPQSEHPNYWDFVYFSFVIGMTFQVSDVQITATPLRRVVVAHGVISFFFSIAILALTVNLGANLL